MHKSLIDYDVERQQFELSVERLNLARGGISEGAYDDPDTSLAWMYWLKSADSAARRAFNAVARPQPKGQNNIKNALQQIKAVVTGDKHPNWTDDAATYRSRGRIADICDNAQAVDVGVSHPIQPALPKSQFPSAIEWQAAMNEIQPAPAAFGIFLQSGKFIDAQEDEAFAKTVAGEFEGVVKPMYLSAPEHPAIRPGSRVLMDQWNAGASQLIRAQALEEAAKVCDDDYEISRGNYEITRSPYSEGAKDTADRIATEIRSIHTSPDSS